MQYYEMVFCLVQRQWLFPNSKSYVLALNPTRYLQNLVLSHAIPVDDILTGREAAPSAEGAPSEGS